MFKPLNRSLLILICVSLSLSINAQPRKTIITGFTTGNETGYPVELAILDATNIGLDPSFKLSSKTQNGSFRLQTIIALPVYIKLKVFTGNNGAITIGNSLGLSDDFSTFFISWSQEIAFIYVF